MDIQIESNTSDIHWRMLVKVSENLPITIPEIQTGVSRFHVLEKNSDASLPPSRPRTQEDKGQVQEEVKLLKLLGTVTITARQLNEVLITRRLAQVRQALLKREKYSQVKQALESISTHDASFAQSVIALVSTTLRDFILSSRPRGPRPFSPDGFKEHSVVQFGVKQLSVPSSRYRLGHRE
ncbi:hypothetical protein BGW38_001329 [Lunasporangiospora selenospora]|uniref:Uncharacterized protein n=1 Tax=Lunasporangiospora selenospora TaxID=979761 RepID=A0A9P6FUD0_9FUNG|nr:hypothetical protein BGW38_001329 [Lunasporangiospora selenospora]